MSNPPNGRSNGSGQKRKDAKTTRVRTVLNEKQLHTLRTCYAANCRPDALMKEQLTEITASQRESFVFGSKISDAKTKNDQLH